eukprot:12960269-Alexandrium_andersonii.AAC.1
MSASLVGSEMCIRDRPEPSGAAYGHVFACALTARGMEARRSWTELWAKGRAPALVVGHWLAVLGVPLAKQSEDPQAARPIVLGEALLKTAMGTILDLATPQAKQALK